MVRVREHVDRLHASHPIIDIEQGQVAGLRSGVATHIHDATGSGKKNCLHHIVVHAGPGRVGNDDIGAPVLFDKLRREQVFHVTGIENRNDDALESHNGLGNFEGFVHILDADDFAHFARHEIGYRPGTGIEVIDQFFSGKGGKIGRHLIEFMCLGRIGLIE